MAFAGSLKFDAKFDSKGFIKGVQEINSYIGQFTDKLGSLKTKAAAAFSVTALVAFTKQSVETAASVNAANSSMSQTFGALEASARAAIGRIADESGILDTRLNSAATGIYAFARTFGMDSASALGLSATETTRNAAAMKLYGKSFQNLSEAQKQLTLLQMVKDANDLSGATGQAAREAEGWENVVGNLKEAWKQLFAVIGQSVLKLAIPVVQSMTSALQRLTETAKLLMDAVDALPLKTEDD